MYFIYLKKRKKESQADVLSHKNLDLSVGLHCHPVMVTLLRRPEATTNGACSCLGIILLVNE